MAASRAQQREEEISAREQEADLERERTAREAAEEAERIQAEATQEAQRKIRRGSLVLGITLGLATLLGGLAIFSGIRLQKAEQQLKSSQELVTQAEEDLDDAQEETKIAQNELNSAKQLAKSASQELEQAKTDLQSIEVRQQEADQKLKLAQQGQQTAQALLTSLKQELEVASVAVAQAEQAKIDAQKLTEETKVTLKVAEQKLLKASQKQKEISELNEILKTLSDLIDDLYASDKPGIANDVIEQIGLSFTDFTEDKFKFKKVLLNSSVALAQLHFQEYEKALVANTNSIQLIESNETLFNASVGGKAIAFFAYSVQGNLSEEQNPNIFPNVSYQKAFNYLGSYPEITQENLIDSYNSALKTFTVERANFRVLVNTSLKKHYVFRTKQAVRMLESALKQRRWEDADLLTWEAIMATSKSKVLDDFSYENVSCKTLDKIDELWYENSKVNGKGHFGFRVQKEIYTEILNSLNEQTSGSRGSLIRLFAVKVGWIRNINNRYTPSPSARYTPPPPSPIPPIPYEQIKEQWHTQFYLDERWTGHLPTLAVVAAFRNNEPTSRVRDLGRRVYFDQKIPRITEHCEYIYFSSEWFNRGSARR
ncbi:MAG: hypothetical protein F6K11_12955 [Leptolyngbya sp. SIO3F4]|nr:hypothetical protein [Leptolyngbya sp. SIO3F4]